MDDLSAVNRELGEVQIRIDALKEQHAADSERQRMDADARVRDVKKCIGRLTEILTKHTTREEEMFSEVEGRVMKLEADNNRHKGITSVLLFIAAAVASVATVLVNKALAAKDALASFKFFH